MNSSTLNGDMICRSQISILIRSWADFTPTFKSGYFLMQNTPDFSWRSKTNPKLSSETGKPHLRLEISNFYHLVVFLMHDPVVERGALLAIKTNQLPFARFGRKRFSSAGAISLPHRRRFGFFFVLPSSHKAPCPN